MLLQIVREVSFLIMGTQDNTKKEKIRSNKYNTSVVLCYVEVYFRAYLKAFVCDMHRITKCFLEFQLNLWLY